MLYKNIYVKQILAKVEQLNENKKWPMIQPDIKDSNICHLKNLKNEKQYIKFKKPYYDKNQETNHKIKFNSF